MDVVFVTVIAADNVDVTEKSQVREAATSYRTRSLADRLGSSGNRRCGQREDPHLTKLSHRAHHRTHSPVPGGVSAAETLHMTLLGNGSMGGHRLVKFGGAG
jgi:hypothetical protein